MSESARSILNKNKYKLESTKVMRYDAQETTSFTRTTSTHLAPRETVNQREVPKQRMKPDGEHRTIGFNRETDEATTETELDAQTTQEIAVPIMGIEVSSIGYESVEEQF